MLFYFMFSLICSSLAWPHPPPTEHGNIEGLKVGDEFIPANGRDGFIDRNGVIPAIGRDGFIPAIGRDGFIPTIGSLLPNTYYSKPKIRWPYYDKKGNGFLLYGYGGKKLHKYTTFKALEGYF